MNPRRWLLGAFAASLLCVAACGDDDSGNSSDGGDSDASSENGKAVCGNGVAQGDELCDGHDLRLQTCTSATQGAMTGGTLACKSDCTFDISHCNEAGDGGGGNSSDGGGSDGGKMDASTDAGDAGNGTCGDGVAQAGELCDGHDLRLANCGSAAGMTGGTLACKSDCTFDVSQCTTEEGDGGEADGG